MLQRTRNLSSLLSRVSTLLLQEAELKREQFFLQARFPESRVIVDVCSAMIFVDVGGWILKLFVEPPWICHKSSKSH